MLAFQLVSAHTTELREVAVPEPGPDEVLVKVGDSGACHSDLHLVHAAAGCCPSRWIRPPGSSSATFPKPSVTSE